MKSQEFPDRKHLSLPRDDFTNLLTGDSITKRINANELSSSSVVRGYGGITVAGLLERVVNTRKKHIPHIQVSVGINDVLQSTFNQQRTVDELEGLIYTINEKFSPTSISVSCVLPVNYRYSSKNPLIAKFNAQIQKQLKCMKFPNDVNVQTLDISKDFDNIQHLTADGLHPNLLGVTQLVQYRTSLAAFNVDISSLPITIRPPHFSRKNTGLQNS